MFLSWFRQVVLSYIHAKNLRVYIAFAPSKLLPLPSYANVLHSATILLDLHVQVDCLTCPKVVKICQYLKLGKGQIFILSSSLITPPLDILSILQVVSELWSPFALISIAFGGHCLGFTTQESMASSEGNYHRRGPYFDGTNFASWKHKMKMHILGHNPAIQAIVCIVLQGEFFDGREPNREATADELKMLQYNAQACDILFNGLCPREFNKSTVLIMQRKFGIL